MTHAPSGPCLLWTIPNGSSAGNMLRTGVLARVLEYVADARVVLLSPLESLDGHLVNAQLVRVPRCSRFCRKHPSNGAPNPDRRCR